MSFGQNLQYLRRLHNGITQEELAEEMGVSRQTVSKWELDAAYPEMEKLIELCRYFSCSMDQLVRENLNIGSEAYSDIRITETPPFRYAKYAVISTAPEDDAIRHITDWAVGCGIKHPDIIGWDFPYLSQEQINVYHMHGYEAACILPEGFSPAGDSPDVVCQKSQKYAVITIKEPFAAPFSLIPNAYKTLMSYMNINGIRHKLCKEVLDCFEKTYEKDSVCYMDVYIAADL